MGWKSYEKNVWDEEIKLTKQAINLVNKMLPRPKFFVVCGDLIDAMPGTMHRTAQEEDFKKIFQGLDSEIPLICDCVETMMLEIVPQKKV